MFDRWTNRIAKNDIIITADTSERGAALLRSLGYQSEREQMQDARRVADRARLEAFLKTKTERAAEEADALFQ